jgi:hypothetical protein
MQGEISYDLIMEDNMSFVEGTYRLVGKDWQVFIFSPGAVAGIQVQHGKWDSGITGVFVRFPKGSSLNKQVVEQVLGQALGVTEWSEGRGPDSMRLR